MNALHRSYIRFITALAVGGCLVLAALKPAAAQVGAVARITSWSVHLLCVSMCRVATSHQAVA